MMFGPIKAATALVSTLAFCGYAHACNGYSLDLEQAGDTEYNPADLTETVGKLVLEVNGPLPDPSCATLPVKISGLAGDVATFRRGSETLTGTRPASSQNLATISTEVVLTNAARQKLLSTGTLGLEFVTFQPGTYAGQGAYQSQLMVAVDNVQTDSELFSYTVPASVRLVGDSASGTGKIDLGQLKTGLTKATSFFYQTNASIAISASSDSGGYLVHERGEDLGRIAYSARIMGQPVSIDGASAVNVSPGTTGPRSGTVEVSVGEVGNPYAGTYSDVLTLSFRAF